MKNFPPVNDILNIFWEGWRLYTHAQTFYGYLPTKAS